VKSGGGKQKGSAFEREVCKRLSLWITGGEKEDCLWRSAMSGGRATLAKRKGVNLSRQAGDISAVAPEGHRLTDRFYVECKHLKTLDLAGLFRDTGMLARVWGVARSEANDYKKLPMLIARQNRLPTLVVLNAAGTNLLNLRSKVCLSQPQLGMNLVTFDDLLLAKLPVLIEDAD